MSAFTRLVFIALVCVQAACAMAFPVPGKPVRVLVGVPPGGGTDVSARIMAEKLQALLGVPVTVENRPGASMTIAATEVARAAPDGHTLLYTPDIPMTQAPHMLDRLPYDARTSFTPISAGAKGPIVLVAHASVPSGSVKELLEYARAHPNALSYGSAGTGSVFHVFGDMLSRHAGVDMVHVPYKGAGDVAKDIVTGRIQWMFAAASGALQFSRSGNVRILAVAGTQRSTLLPGVPTLGELGYPGFEIDGWLGWFGPAQMEPQTVRQLAATLRQVLADPQVQERLRGLAYEAYPTTPAELGTLVNEGYARWGELIRRQGLPR